MAIKSEAKNGVEIISVHVPKTAGSAFTRVLLRVYGPEAVFLDYPYEKDYQRQFMQEGDAKVKVIHGHFPGAKYKNKFPDAKRVIWLREPVKFLISYYCFNKVFRRTVFYDLLQKKNLSFLEFAELPENQNLMSVYLRDMKLEDFYFVGIQDYFKEDLEELTTLLSWQDVKVSQENNNLYSDYKAIKEEVFSDRSLVDKVARLNAKDMELYQEALSLREKRKGKKVEKAQTQIVSKTKEIKRIYIRGCPRSGNTLMLYLCGTGFKNSHILENEQIPVPQKSPPDKITFGKLPSPQLSKQTQKQAHHFLKEEDAGVIFMIRDPRDVLLSEHGEKPGEPWIKDANRWLHNALLLKKMDKHPGVVVVKYEDLITKPNETQAKIATALGLEIKLDFSECHHKFPNPSKVNLKAIKKVRPLDPSSINKWQKNEADRDYVMQKLESKPAIFRLMKYFGYLQKEGKVKINKKEAIANNNLEDLFNSKLWCKKGHLNREQAMLISNLCKIVQPESVLETGFATGRSASVVLSSCSPKTFLSLDKNLDYMAPFGREMAGILMEEFKNYRVIEGDSNELLNDEFYQQNYPNGLDWFTIDGDHSYKGCLHDLESSFNFLSPQGIAIVDDYKSKPPKGVRFPAVNKAVRDFCDRHPKAHKLEWHKDGKGLAILSKSPKILKRIAKLLNIPQPQKKPKAKKG